MTLIFCIIYVYIFFQTLEWSAFPTFGDAELNLSHVRTKETKPGMSKHTEDSGLRREAQTSTYGSKSPTDMPVFMVGRYNGLVQSME